MDTIIYVIYVINVIATFVAFLAYLGVWLGVIYYVTIVTLVGVKWLVVRFLMAVGAI